jgi:hypothetical protein
MSMPTGASVRFRGGQGKQIPAEGPPPAVPVIATLVFIGTCPRPRAA